TTARALTASAEASRANLRDLAPAVLQTTRTQARVCTQLGDSRRAAFVIQALQWIVESVMPRLYWLSDAEFSRMELLLPRGRRGARRVDDCRVISGIVHMLQSGARWRDSTAEYGPYTT